MKIRIPKINIKLNKRFLVTGISTLLLIGLVIIGRQNPFKNDKLATVLPEDSLLDSLEGLNTPTIQAYTAHPDDDKYTAFFFEVYELIKSTYWNAVSDEQLSKVSKLAIEKVTENTITNSTNTKDELRVVLKNQMSNMKEEEKKTFITQISDILLANLEPFGRSRLYTSKKQQELSNTVRNVNPNVNHYDVLEVTEEATTEDIEKAYSEKLADLNSQEQTEEVLGEKNKVEKAFQVLTDQTTKQIYDQQGADPTMIGKLINPSTYYVHIIKFSPTTVAELDNIMTKVDQGTTLDTLILDLRGNIGGAIDGLPWFLGPFIGNDQYAYQFFKRGEKQDFKTKTGWLNSLVRYKKVIVLTDDQVQSSGEVFASVLKKYNVGVLVGTPTKGWGTVESVFKINNQIAPETETYSVFLVHSLTLREDGVPIEGKGVLPHVDTSNPNWQSELYRYYSDNNLVNTVSNLLSNPPITQ